MNLYFAIDNAEQQNDIKAENFMLCDFGMTATRRLC